MLCVLALQCRYGLLDAKPWKHKSDHLQAKSNVSASNGVFGVSISVCSLHNAAPEQTPTEPYLTAMTSVKNVCWFVQVCCLSCECDCVHVCTLIFMTVCVHTVVYVRCMYVFMFA